MVTYPYAQPINALSQIISKLRSSFPERVDSSVLKKLGIASNNESYIINTLRFIGIIDKDGTRTEDGHSIFVLGDDDFPTGLASLIKKGYTDLFDLYADSAWALEKPKLVTYFRKVDKSTEVVGSRQAETFIRLAEMSGRRQSTETATSVDASKREVAQRKRKPTEKPKVDEPSSVAKTANINPDVTPSGGGEAGSTVSLAVRVEVNLPATADQNVYDAIFKSIRANLIDRDQA